MPSAGFATFAEGSDHYGSWLDPRGPFAAHASAVEFATWKQL